MEKETQLLLTKIINKIKIEKGERTSTWLMFIQDIDIFQLLWGSGGAHP